AAPFGDHGAAVDLAGLGSGDALDELDRLGNLVGGQAGLRVPDDLGLVRYRVGAGPLHDGVHPLAPFRVGQPEDDHVADARVLRQRGLHFSGKDVGAAGLDHVDPTVGDVQVALVVHPPEIADGGEAVCGHRGLGHIAQVLVDQDTVPRSHIDLTDLV